MDIGNLNPRYGTEFRPAALFAERGKRAVAPGLKGLPPAAGGSPFTELLERAYGKNGGAAEGPGGETLPPGAPELGTREAGYPGPENTAAPPPLSSSASAASSASAGGVVDKTSRLYEQCEALEALLIKNLVQSMRNTVQKTELTGAGFAGEIYEDMLYDEYAKDFAKNARFGFAELAYLELTGQRGKRIARYS